MNIMEKYLNVVNHKKGANSRSSLNASPFGKETANFFMDDNHSNVETNLAVGSNINIQSRHLGSQEQQQQIMSGTGEFGVNRLPLKQKQKKTKKAGWAKMIDYMKELDEKSPTNLAKKSIRIVA